MEQNQQQQNPPEQSLRKAPRSWLYGAMFVCALSGAVAYATYSSRPTPTANLVPALPEAADSQLPEVKPSTAAPSAEPSAPLTKIVWEDSFEAAMQKARLQNKPIMVDFYTDWCSACKLLDRDVYPQKTVIAESANWVSIKINSEKRPDVAGAYGVTSLPTIIFAENSGKPVSIMQGYAPSMDFAATMKTARSKIPKIGL